MLFYLALIVFIFFAKLLSVSKIGVACSVKCSPDNATKLSFKDKLYKFLILDGGLVLICLIIICSLRKDTVGTDLAHNKVFYNTMKLDNGYSIAQEKLNYELGYAFLCWICAKIGLPFNIIMILASCLFLTSFWLLAKKHSTDVFMSWAILLGIGLFEFSLSGLRQTFAIAFILFGMYFLFQKKYWIYYIFVLVAFFFHYTAIFACIFPFFYKIKFKTPVAILLTAIILLCSIFIKPLCDFIVSIIKIDYFKDYAVQYQKVSIFHYIWIAGMIALLVLLLICKSKFKVDKPLKTHLNLYAWLLFCSIILKISSILAGFEVLARFINYCCWSVAFIIPIVFELFMERYEKLKKYKKLLYLAIFVCVMTYFGLKLAIFDSSRIIPYTLFWK